jgi:hypothetical protein
MFSTNEIIFASLVGSKVAESLPRFAMVQNEIAKHVLPPIPFIKPADKVEIADSKFNFDKELWKADTPNIAGQFFPIQFRSAAFSLGTYYTFPYEPMISISGKNIIARRNIAKAPNVIGTVKEHWCQDDYEITITGSIFGAKEIGNYAECYPISDFEKLRDYCTDPSGLEVLCEPLQLLGIDRLIVDSFSFPFTKGENVQAYEIKCYSDFSANYLLEIED